MIFDDLRKVVQNNAGLSNRTYLLNLLKEKIQDYILYFVYTNNDYREVVFTGGTCLRKVYGLNRLSVDLDFDYEGKSFLPAIFAKKLRDWFLKTHQLENIEVVVRKETVKIKLDGGSKFPEIGKNVIFVSVDFSPIGFKKYGMEQNLISTPEFSFFVRNFDLPTLFANKINAFLGRKFFHGSGQEHSFKARDVYDLFWLCQRSRQSQYRLRPSFERLFEELKTNDKSKIFSKVIEKIDLLEEKQLLIQLLPFFPDRSFVESFVTSYKKILIDDIRYIFG